MSITVVTMKSKCLFLLFLLVLGVARTAAAPDSPAPSGVSLVLTYTAKPEQRVPFREWVETEGARRFEQWRQQGVFSSYRLLFNSFASAANPDLVVVLDFPSFASSAAWREIERRSPGGLTADALRLASVESTCYGEPLSRRFAAGSDARKAAYMIITYNVLTTASKYKEYVLGYTAPQMNEWVKDGALTGYVMFMNQTPHNVPWDSMLVLEYADLAGMARREEIKVAARARLNASDPVFKKFTDSKNDIRTDRAMFYADAITAGNN